jgi:copper chaperone CopZ
MKKQILSLVLLSFFAAPVMANCGKEHAEKDKKVRTEAAAPAVIDDKTGNVTVAIDGMTCSTCKQHVEKGLKALSGQIKTVEVSLNKMSATLKILKVKDMTPEQKTDLMAKIKEAISKAGYTPVNI